MFLQAAHFDTERATAIYKQHLVWRQQNRVDEIIQLQKVEYEHIKEFLPSGFHETDKEGHPIFILQFGAAKLSSLFESCTKEIILQYFIKEIETMLRLKLLKSGIQLDQMMIIIDMKAAKFKDLSNRQLNAQFKVMVGILQDNYPGLLYRCYVVNTPIFMQDYWEMEIKPLLSVETRDKVVFTGENIHSGLTQTIAPTSLPRLYGGLCQCTASCVYSDKGPWSERVNKVNYRDRDQHEDIMDEEYKFQDQDDSDEEEDYQQIDDEQNDIDRDQRLADLKGQLQMNFGKAKKKPAPDDSDDSQEEDISSFDMGKLQKMLQGGRVKGKPGETPMNTEMEDGI